MSCPRTSFGSWQVANSSSRCLTQSTDRYRDCTNPCPGIILQNTLTIYEELSVQAGYLQLHMQLSTRGCPCDSLATLGVAVEQVKLSYLLPGTWREEQ